MKVKTKSIIVLMIALFAVLLLGTTKVNAYGICEAVVETGKIAEDFTIPDTFNLDIKMSEIEKAPKLIIEQLAKELSKQGVQIKIVNEYNEIGEKSHITVVVDSEKTMRVYVYGDNYNTITDKTVNIIYNNYNNYNENDRISVENALKKLDKENNQYLVEEYVELGNLFDMAQLTIKGLEKMLNDSSITITQGAGGSGGQPPLFTFENGSVYYIYKNHVYYKSIIVDTTIKMKITIPSREDAEQYVTSKVEKYISDYNNDYAEDFGRVLFSRLEKINENKYKVYYKSTDGTEQSDEILIQQAKPTIETVTKENTTTGIKLETTTAVVPSNTILSSVTVTEQKTLDTVNKALKDTTSKYKVYDINLLKDGAKIQPNGKVKISIPIPNDYNKSKLEVYRIDDNGEIIKYNVTVNGEYASFETDHFSIYVLAEKKEETAPSTPTVNKGEKDETPKTGIQDITYIITAVVIISAVGIIATIKRKQSKH